ncbi:LysR family transcriptional regulator [Aestuariispira ectoiniformans]|uniref:LysR family transcriptional regulator n=1 Tax=Aestuariispira ectoiniformans TaxID=2775080 RepID=UPI00223B5351|nr:LysR family transcriptional regulator [Aestuariispira ectoiniformans]
MDLISDMKLFVSILSHQSLAGAARELGLSPASATQRLKNLEDYLRAPLLVRSTRSMSLTPAGETFLQSCQRVLPEVDQLVSDLAAQQGDIRGHLRISAPNDLGHHHIRKLADNFIYRHPCVTVDLVLSDQPVDLTGDGFDFAFRYGMLNDSSMIARKLLDNWRTPCASPAYLEKHGEPATPKDLLHHNCLILLRDRTPMDRWPFADGDGIQEVKVSGDRASNNGEMIRCWAAEGKGIAFKSYLDVAEDIRKGRLMPLLSDFTIGSSPLSLLYNSSGRQLERIRTFVQEAAKYFDTMTYHE